MAVLGNQITSSEPGFFIYFNSGSNVPGLVFSRDIGDSDADLAILSRFDNLAGQPNSIVSITAARFTVTPEPSSVLMTAAGIAAARRLLRRKHQSS